MPPLSLLYGGVVGVGSQATSEGDEGRLSLPGVDGGEGGPLFEGGPEGCARAAAQVEERFWILDCRMGKERLGLEAGGCGGDCAGELGVCGWEDKGGVAERVEGAEWGLIGGGEWRVGRAVGAIAFAKALGGGYPLG